MASDLQTEESELDKLKAACQAASSETQAVRQKLHNAIRKGKALEADKQQKADQIQLLQQQLDGLSGASQSATSAGGASFGEAAVSRLQQERSALQSRVEQLLAQEDQFNSERQQAAKHSAEQERELESRLHHSQFLEEALKAKQRELAAGQGEVLLLQAALDAAQEELDLAAKPQAPAANKPEVARAEAVSNSDRQQVRLQGC